MEIVVLVFCLGWVAKHVVGGRVDEYSHAQETHRQKYLGKIDRDHPSWGRARREQFLRNAARRNAAGHFAYLLRHGWSPTFNDVGEGWKNAKAAHEQWKADNPRDETGRKPRLWVMFREGWRTRRALRRPAPEPVAPVEAEPEPAPTPKPKPATSPQDTAAPEVPKAWLNGGQAEDAEIVPMPTRNHSASTTPGGTAGSTNGATVTTPINAGEATNLDDVRRNSAAFAATLTQVNSAAEQLLADVLRFASKDAETRARIQRGMEMLDGAIAEFAGMPKSLQKHQLGEEYAASGHAVDDINALRSS